MGSISDFLCAISETQVVGPISEALVIDSISELLV